MNLRPLYIFDFDGTLSNAEHRTHLIEKPNPDWNEFYLKSVYDTPIKSNIKTMHMLWLAGADIFIWSGRSDIVRESSVEWLSAHASIDKHSILKGERNAADYFEYSLKMRPEKDRTPDNLLKQNWYMELSQEDSKRLVAVFDDRNKVVDMWRDLGLTCFHVAPGNF